MPNRRKKAEPNPRAQPKSNYEEYLNFQRLIADYHGSHPSTPGPARVNERDPAMDGR